MPHRSLEGWDGIGRRGHVYANDLERDRSEWHPRVRPW